ncbi:hypothetical protein ACFX2G_014623 [Malus domestica]
MVMLLGLELMTHILPSTIGSTVTMWRFNAALNSRDVETEVLSPSSMLCEYERTLSSDSNFSLVIAGELRRRRTNQSSELGRPGGGIEAVA